VVATASYAGGFLQGSASGPLTTEDQTLTLDVALHDSGEIRGLVVPATGSDPAPLSQVTVQVAGWSQSVVSDPDGSFQFPQVPSGLAKLTADVLGSIDLGSATAEVPARRRSLWFRRVVAWPTPCSPWDARLSPEERP
jgi:hypothetical protein